MYLDLHIHSALSPCSDDDMTPNNIINMAKIKGLDGISITDHNSVKNLPAFDKLSKLNNIEFIPGLELTTIEEIHVLLYFKKLDDAMVFGKFLHDKLNNTKNNKKIFGNQLVLNEKDELLSEEEVLLINSTNITINSLDELSKIYGFFYVPAHIDKSSFSILSQLGFIPSDLNIEIVEISKKVEPIKFLKNNNLFNKVYFTQNSDAHNLIDILEKEFIEKQIQNNNHYIYKILRGD